MWREARLAFTDTIADSHCSVIPAHPWVNGLGQQTANGNYLSPVNAVAWLARKLAGLTDTTEVVIFMVTGQSYGSFMASLSALADVFPAPAFTQVKRLAASSATLAEEKMLIPARITDGLPPSVPLSVPTSRTALAAAAIQQAQSHAGAGSGIAQIKQQLAAFGQQREAMLADIATGLGDLQGRSATAWVFTGQGNPATTVLQLLRDVPQPSAIYTAAMMLVGENLEGIRSMIHEYESDTGA